MITDRSQTVHPRGTARDRPRCFPEKAHHHVMGFCAPSSRACTSQAWTMSTSPGLPRRARRISASNGVVAQMAHTWYPDFDRHHRAGLSFRQIPHVSSQLTPHLSASRRPLGHHSGTSSSSGTGIEPSTARPAGNRPIALGVHRDCPTCLTSYPATLQCVVHLDCSDLPQLARIHGCQWLLCGGAFTHKWA
jgi:hypothetical protein